MKNFLLDTHVLLWAIVDMDELSQKVQAVLQDSDNHMTVSSLSLWEIALKYSLGKLDLENITVNSIPEHCNKLGIKQISLTPSDAISFSRLPLFENHRDPFDRMLIWQAIQNNYTLISRDKLFAPYEQYGLKLLW